MGIRVLSDASVGHAVVYDSVTMMPLPMELFGSEIHAEHFLIWARENDREPFSDDTDVYDAELLAASYADWHEANIRDDDLTEEAYDQWTRDTASWK